MKKSIIIQIILAITTSGLMAQTAPLTIRGELMNCAEKNLLIAYRMPSGETLLDTILVNPDGKFFLQTNKVNAPLLASIQKNNVQINDLFVAPGYALYISGDAKDFKTLLATKKITGKGAESNAYRLRLTSMMLAAPRTKDWFELEKDSLLLHINQSYQQQDSIATIVFETANTNDAYLDHFYKMVQYDNLFQKLYKLLAHVNVGAFYSAKERTDFIGQNFDTTLLNNLYDPKYLISEYYRTWVMTNEWPAYLKNRDSKSQSQGTTPTSSIQKVWEMYPAGEVRAYVMTQLMLGAINNSKSFDQINNQKKSYEAYIASLHNENNVTRLEEAFSKKEAELNRTLVGKPAPHFNLESNLGKQYQLQDFRGSVVYIDFWASWCGPCRAAMPSMKALHEQYKGDDRIVFIGIDVNDGEKEWKKAIRKDQPTWLQLYDRNDDLFGAYAIRSIPRYILVDKQGNIIHFDAPGPEEKEAIEKLINEAIAK